MGHLLISNLVRRGLWVILVILVAVIWPIKAWAQHPPSESTCNKPCIVQLDNDREIDGQHYTLITVTNWNGCAHGKTCELRDAIPRYPITNVDGKGTSTNIDWWHTERHERLRIQQLWLRSVYNANQEPRTVLKGCVLTGNRQPPDFADQAERRFCPNGVVNYYAVPSNGWRAPIRLPREQVLSNEQRAVDIASTACAALNAAPTEQNAAARQKCDKNKDILGASAAPTEPPVPTAEQPTPTETAEQPEDAALVQDLQERLALAKKNIEELLQKKAAAEREAEANQRGQAFWFVVSVIFFLAFLILVITFVKLIRRTRELAKKLQQERSQATLPPNNARIRELEEELDKAKRRFDHQVDKDRKDIEEVAAAAKKKLDEQKKEVADLREELARKNRELGDVRNVYIATEADNKRLINENRQLSVENQKLREAASRESAEKQAVSMRASQLQDQLRAQQPAVSRSPNTLTGLGAVTADVASLQTELGDVRNAYIALEADNKRLEQAKSALEISLQEARAETEIKAERIQELEQRVNDLEEGSSVRELREKVRQAEMFATEAHKAAEESAESLKLADEEFASHLADRDQQIADLQARNDELELALKSANDNSSRSPTTENPVSPTTENPVSPTLEIQKEIVNLVHDRLLAWIAALRRVTDLKSNLAVCERTLGRLDPPKGEDDEYALKNHAVLERKISSTHAELAQAQDDLREKELVLVAIGADRLTIREMSVEASETFTQYTDRLVGLEFLIDQLNERMRAAPSPSMDSPVVAAFFATIPHLMVLLDGNPDVAEDADPVDIMGQVVDLAEKRQRQMSELTRDKEAAERKAQVASDKLVENEQLLATERQRAQRAFAELGILEKAVKTAGEEGGEDGEKLMAALVAKERVTEEVRLLNISLQQSEDELEKLRRQHEQVLATYRQVVGMDFDPADAPPPESCDFGAAERSSMPFMPYVSVPGKHRETMRPQSNQPPPPADGLPEPVASGGNKK